MAQQLRLDLVSPASSVEIIIGDALSELKKLPAESVHCCITSPPYFGLRDYQCEGQLGLEATPAGYLAALVEVFAELRRVLRDDGTFWLVMGDSYARAAGKGQHKPGDSGKQNYIYTKGGGRVSVQISLEECGVKEKDLMMMPHRLAIALQEDGWWVRQDVVWSKRNPMPESVTDRPTRSHEYIFLLTKSARYYYDAAAVREPAVSDHSSGQKERILANGNGRMRLDTHMGSGVPWTQKETRNRRSVWTINTKPYLGAHFATFPPALVEPCLLAGCPPDGTVMDPFAGSGTVGEVAQKHGRNAVLIEINESNRTLIEARLAKVSGITDNSG